MTREKRNDIQWLRALAATEVIAWHSDLATKHFSPDRFAESSYAPLGGIGVELFFIVSGYIIGMTAPSYRSAAAYMRSRVLRLYPLYWIFTTLVVVAYWCNPDWAQGASRLDWGSVVRSYLILPQAQYPILGVGWSLEHEMIFYVLVALTMGAFGGLPVRARAVLGCLLVMLGILGFVLGTGPKPLYWEWHVTSPYLVAFAVGWLFRLADMQTAAIRRALYVAVFGGVAVMAMAPIAVTEHGLVFRLAVAAAVFVAVCAARPILQPDTAVNRLASKIGDASYSAYLSHVFVLSVAGKILGQLGIPAQFDLAIRLLAVTLCLALGLCCYRLIEKPVDRLLRGRAEPRRAVPDAGPSSARRVAL